MRLLIVGISTRAATAAARRGDWLDVVGLDYFGDRDQRRNGETYALGDDFGLQRTPDNLVRAATALRYGAFAYTSSLENHPDLVARLAEAGEGRAVLLGNSPRTLARVRHVPSLSRICRAAGIAFPTTLLRARSAPPVGVWLCKPRAAGGGHGISLCSPHDEQPGRQTRVMLQRFRAGLPFSATFVANGRTAVVLGVAEGLAGLSSFGASGFTYCGNLVPPRGDAARWISLLPRLREIATVLTNAFGLVGLNSMDLIAGSDGSVTLLEVNPRYSASMELIEYAGNLPLFAWHSRAILTGWLPVSAEVTDRAAGGATWGKAILYARRPVVVTQTDAWLDRGVCDVPHSGESIATGAPICTLMTSTPAGGDACLSILGEQAEWIERLLKPPCPTTSDNVSPLESCRATA